MVVDITNIIPLVIKFVVCSRLLITDLGKLISKFCARTASSTTCSRSASHSRRPDICFLSIIMSIFLNAFPSSDPSRSISVSFVASTPSSSPMLNHLLRTSKRQLYTAARSSRVRATGNSRDHCGLCVHSDGLCPLHPPPPPPMAKLYKSYKMDSYMLN